MIRIVSDTSTMYSPKEAEEVGFSVSPLYVSINNKGYKELEEIDSSSFIDLINDGGMPTSSQPAIGDVQRLYEKYPDDEIINICMAHGLSGTYQSAIAAANMIEDEGRIHVINSMTLCGPHRHIVEVAIKMANSGHSVDEIKSKIKELINSAKSYLIPSDFAYLRRGGRLSATVSYVGQVTKLAPIMTQSENGEQLVVDKVCMSFKQAIKVIADRLEKVGIGEGWKVYITHGGAEELAEKAKQMIAEKIPNAIYEKMMLTPAFITQGGPGCVAVQYVKL